MGRFLFFIILLISYISCQAQPVGFKLGAERTREYLPLLEGKRVALLVNPSSMVGSTHLLDYLLMEGIEVTKVFAPEHGFRGNVEAGMKVKDGIDPATGLPVISLYGKQKKATPEMLKDIDLVVFDIQDVGARFYTYIYSMFYMMQACAENNKMFVVLDRPNPNGYYVDGPILEEEFKSFVGLLPLPVVHGLTVGELANMINQEGWLGKGVPCDLKVIGMSGYAHDMPYSLPVRPSPNLPNDQSIMLYPSLCFFEGTNISLGRGTDMPFQVIGYPNPIFGDFTFTPVPIPGIAATPPHQNTLCYGVDLRKVGKLYKLDLSYLISFYKKWPKDKPFFTDFFDKLAGTDELRAQIEKGWTEEKIRSSWQAGLNEFKKNREQYLLYPETSTKK